MGLVSCLWPSASLHDLEKEVLGILEAVGLAPDGLDEIVGSLQFARTDRMVGMVEDALQMGIDRGGEPDDLGDLALPCQSHPLLHAVLQIASVRLGERQLELLQQDVGDGEIGVLGKQVVQPLLLARTHDASSRRQRESLLKEVFLQLPVVLARLCVLLLERGAACRQHEPHVLEQLVLPPAVLLLQFVLLAAPHQGDHRIVVELHDMEQVEHDLHMGSPLAECAVVLGVHVHRNGLHPAHPTLAHGLDEMQDLFLLLALLAEQHIPTFDIDDHRRVPVPPVQQELVDGDMGAVALRGTFREQ